MCINFKPRLEGKVCIVTGAGMHDNLIGTGMATAVALGREAVKLALDDKTGIMPVLLRTNDQPYQWSIGEGDLKDIANAEKTLPENFISEDGFRITQAGVDYLKPLTIGESYPKFKDGVPIYEQLDLHLAEV